MMEKELKTKGPKQFKFTNSYSIKDYWKYYCKNSKTIPYEQYRDILYFILEQYSLLISDHAMDMTFPYKLGKILIRKHLQQVKFDEEGNLISKLPVDYKATKDLWDKDPEAKERKQLVYCLNQHSEGWWFSIKYQIFNQLKSHYKVKFLTFKPARKMTRRFAKNIKEYKIDATEYEVCEINRTD